MGYQIDSGTVTLDDLRRRIQDTDLVPSRASLLDGIELKFKKLEHQGIKNLADLRKVLKSSMRLEAVSKDTGINTDYLVLLRREIEGYFPKAILLKSFDWLSQDATIKLEELGICDTAKLFEAVSNYMSISELAKNTGMDGSVLEDFLQLADLMRVQWVSPTVARMLVEAGYDCASKVAEADADDLYESLFRVNEEGRFFKGKIGLRDIKRLVRAAGYVSNWDSF